MQIILQSVQNITFSKHFTEPKVTLRGISASYVGSLLKDPKQLETVIDQGEEAKGHKYALLFHESNKYDIKIIISIKGTNLNVMTAHKQNKKRRRVFEKWQKRKLR